MCHTKVFVMNVRVCARACVCVRARVRVYVCVCVCVRACVRVCLRSGLVPTTSLFSSLDVFVGPSALLYFKSSYNLVL